MVAQTLERKVMPGHARPKHDGKSVRGFGKKDTRRDFGLEKSALVTRGKGDEQEKDQLTVVVVQGRRNSRA